MNPLAAEIEKAFDYRGDVTLTLKDGRKVEGYLFNREAQGSPRCSEPFVEMMFPDSDEKKLFKYSDIARVELTGKDTAAGKSWEEWAAKEETRKKTTSSV